MDKLILNYCGVLLRLYNLNYESLWFDEIVSFWVSEPFISFSDIYLLLNHNQVTFFI